MKKKEQISMIKSHHTTSSINDENMILSDINIQSEEVSAVVSLPCFQDFIISALGQDFTWNPIILHEPETDPASKN